MDKYGIMIDYALKHRLKVFIETGTYKGNTIKAMFKADIFNQIHTIDISLDYAEGMARRFARIPSVHCWKGTSAERLPCVLQSIHEPTLFWLDAHYPLEAVRKSKGLLGTPLVAELKAIMAHSGGHVVLIDDAQYYEKLGKKYQSYPRIRDIEQLVKETRPDWVVTNEDNIIRCVKESKNESN